MHFLSPKCLRSIIEFTVIFCVLCAGGISSIAQDDSTPSALTNIYLEGIALLGHGEYQAAIDYFTQLIAANPADAEAYLHRANAYWAIQRNGLALDDLNSALQVNPNFAEAYSLRGNIYLDLNNAGRALREFNRALALNPLEVNALMGRAQVKMELHRLDDALDDAAQAVEAEPNNAETYRLRGTVYAMLQEPDLALNDLYRYSGMVGDAIDPSVSVMISQQETLLQSPPPEATPTFHALLAQVLEARRTQDFQRIIDLTTQGISFYPDIQDFYELRMYANIVLGNYAEVIEDADTVLTFDRLNPSALDYRAAANLYLDNFQLAINDATLVIGHFPNWAAPYLTRGISYGALGQTYNMCLDIRSFIQLASNEELAQAADFMEAVQQVCGLPQGV
ncbi:MAG: tetratricopeptide repeat protein [Anaerolineae bacterium]